MNSKTVKEQELLSWEHETLGAQTVVMAYTLYGTESSPYRPGLWNHVLNSSVPFQIFIANVQRDVLWWYESRMSFSKSAQKSLTGELKRNLTKSNMERRQVKKDGEF